MKFGFILATALAASAAVTLSAPGVAFADCPGTPDGISAGYSYSQTERPFGSSTYTARMQFSDSWTLSYSNHSLEHTQISAAVDYKPDPRQASLEAGIYVGGGTPGYFYPQPHMWAFYWLNGSGNNWADLGVYNYGTTAVFRWDNTGSNTWSLFLNGNPVSGFQNLSVPGADRYIEFGEDASWDTVCDWHDGMISQTTSTKRSCEFGTCPGPNWGACFWGIQNSNSEFYPSNAQPVWGCGRPAAPVFDSVEALASDALRPPAPIPVLSGLSPG